MLTNLMHTGLFLSRLPFLLFYVPFYFLVLQWLPLGQPIQKVLVWGILGIPWIIWRDLQIDGVKRGSLSQHPPSKMPKHDCIIAVSFTSPIDAVYLCAVFDPIFTISYPNSRKVQRISFFRAILQALSPSQLRLDPGRANTTDLKQLMEKNPGRVIAVFPECGTTNGQGILPFSPSLLTVPADVPIFPVSIRYTPADLTTPVPGAYYKFLWKLLSRPTHTIRIRIAESVFNVANAKNGADASSSSSSSRGTATQSSSDVTFEEQRVLDRIGENLARLGRNKRVGLTLKDKANFVEAWNKR